MLTSDVIARRGPAVRDGARRFWVGATKTQARAAAFGGYVLAALVMLVLVVTALAPDDSGPPAAAPVTPATAPANVPRAYTVAEGDTLASVAERFGLEVDELRALNPNVDPMILAPGSKLLLRRAAQEKTASPPSPPPPVTSAKAADVRTPPAAPPPAPALESTRVHVVSPGDTLFGIALAYGTSVDALVALNPSIDPQVLFSGQEIRVP